jgi:pyruvate/2-oxoglutarate/acetoin dehydrogenase E1 component
MRSEQGVRELTYAQAIQEGLSQAMEADPRVIVIGEGVPDPKAIFATTAGLREKFGSQRVFDMPLSENGMTGICIGAALSGIRPVMVHQRIDFSLLAMDQLVNNAAKWHYMFDGLASVPLVVRVIIGRGWGQGPQHSQSLQALFAHIPGFKVVLPATPYDAKGMLISAIEDNNPVIFIEHRWLHNIRDVVPTPGYRAPLEKARVVHAGDKITVAAFSYMSWRRCRRPEHWPSKVLTWKSLTCVVRDHSMLIPYVIPLERRGTYLCSTRLGPAVVWPENSLHAWSSANSAHCVRPLCAWLRLIIRRQHRIT